MSNAEDLAAMQVPANMANLANRLANAVVEYQTNHYVPGNGPIQARGVSLRNENPPNGSTAAAWAGGVTGGTGGIRQVRFAVWTTANNQDDLVWYDGYYVGDNNWIAQVDIAKHKNRTGDYTMHTYAYDNAGNGVYIGGAHIVLGNGR
jgi:hypothetical protein